MAGLLSGLAGLGLDNLENVDIFGEEKKEEQKAAAASKEAPKVEEKDLIYDKVFKCPVCDVNFSTKIVKTGKARLIGTDWDLRPRYEGIHTMKYDVQLCPNCGYAALSRYFASISPGQAKLIKENISKNVKLTNYEGETYSYEQALERFKLCLANAVVKRAKASEKAYICLRTAWLLRGYQEAEDGKAKAEELKEAEESYLLNAYNGFVEARQNEPFPMCGMDEVTMDYLLAELSAHLKKYDVASRLVQTILTSANANTRMKDKARDLKERILAEMKKK